MDLSDGAAGIIERSILRHTKAHPHQHEAEQTCCHISESGAV